MGFFVSKKGLQVSFRFLRPLYSTRNGQAKTGSIAVGQKRGKPPYDRITSIMVAVLLLSLPFSGLSLKMHILFHFHAHLRPDFSFFTTARMNE